MDDKKGFPLYLFPPAAEAGRNGGVLEDCTIQLALRANVQKPWLGPVGVLEIKTQGEGRVVCNLLPRIIDAAVLFEVALYVMRRDLSKARQLRPYMEGQWRGYLAAIEGAEEAVPLSDCDPPPTG